MSGAIIDYSYENRYKNEDGLVFPCVIISGVMTGQELELFRSSSDLTRTADALPLFVEFEGEHRQIGVFFLDLDFVLDLKYIADYSITLCESDEKRKEIDLQNGEDLMKFIRL